ncbi:MAG: hypothetical protein ACRD0U_19410 [Acidimicrobiales bacterium]
MRIGDSIIAGEVKPVVTAGSAQQLVREARRRVKAGWDRTAPEAALVNRLRVRDAALDAPTTNVAAEIRVRDEVSVADAHLGAVVVALVPHGAITVITSDPADVAKVGQPHAVTVVTL